MTTPSARDREEAERIVDQWQREWFITGLSYQMRLDLAQRIARAREEEREQCCKDICYFCANGNPALKTDEHNYWHHDHGDVLPATCGAAAIRGRTA